MSIGRNDPCSCGSGKKYKKCCLITQEQKTIPNLIWKNFNKIDKQMAPKLMKFCLKTDVGRQLYEELYILFNPDFEEFEQDDSKVLPELLDDEGLFFPWLLFNSIDYQGKTIVDYFLEKEERKLRSDELRYLHSINRVPFSYYEVLSVQPDIGLEVRDLLLDKEFFINERMGTQTLQKGHIVYGRVQSVDDLNMFMGMGGYPLDISTLKEILDLKEDFSEFVKHGGKKGLLEYLDCDLLLLYLRKKREMNDQREQLPTIVNTDDDLMEECVIYYNVKDADKVYEVLKKLNVLAPKDKDELDEFNELECDKHGKVKKANMDWVVKGNKKHKHWTNTVLGRFELEAKKLLVFVNSQARADKIKKIIQKKLADCVVFKKMTIESQEALMQKIKDAPDPSPKEIQENQAAMQKPDVQAIMAQHIENHSRQWVNEKIPLLDNISPKEAIKNKKGRILVEKMLKDMEENVDLFGKPFNDVDLIRSLLGI